jgi:organic radical activating enzyme
MTLVPNVSEVNFGLVPVNNPATQQFTVTNTGGEPLTSILPSLLAQLLQHQHPAATNSLGAGQSTNFTVRYLPTAEGGPYPGTLTISDNRTIRTITLTAQLMLRPLYPLPKHGNQDRETGKS